MEVMVSGGWVVLFFLLPQTHSRQAQARTRPQKVCVLSNLLDNAIEAQTFVDNKRVEVFIDENEDVCSLKIYNSISDDMVKAFKEDTLFKTHKKDKLMHGYGLKNVNDVVKKYNGRINYSIIGTCVLCCSVILYREK